MSTTPESEVPEPDSMTIDPANLGSVDPSSVEGIFLVALGKKGAEREAFLGAQCVDDDQRQRVEALLGAYEKAGNFLQKPAVAAEPTPIGQYLAPCELPGTLGRLGPMKFSKRSAAAVWVLSLALTIPSCSALWRLKRWLRSWRGFPPRGRFLT